MMPEEVGANEMGWVDGVHLKTWLVLANHTTILSSHSTDGNLQPTRTIAQVHTRSVRKRSGRRLLCAHERHNVHLLVPIFLSLGDKRVNASPLFRPGFPRPSIPREQHGGSTYRLPSAASGAFEFVTQGSPQRNPETLYHSTREVPLEHEEEVDS
jgi:hypothetical protein